MKVKYFIVGLIIVIIDRITKLFLINNSFVLIPNVLELNYTENKGIAFGLAYQHSSMIIIVTFAIIIGLLIYIISEREKISNLYPYIMVISGGIGNLIDRLVRRESNRFYKIKIY